MKHVISIGIDRANGLTPLSAAISGAKEFASWGESQGYSVDLFVDEEKNVTQSEIFERISEIVESKVCEQLIVYFAGHGILRSPSQEIWLLSNARINPNESINLTGSIDNARTCGIPYLVFISDACRVLPTELQLTSSGSLIFPIIDDMGQESAIDVLFATRPGNPALEHNSKSNAEKFGLFSQALLEILSGKYPELIKANPTGEELISYYDVEDLALNSNYKNLSIGHWYINTINSESSLKSLVSKKASDISITLQQNPEIRIQYQNPKPSLAEFDDVTAKELLISSKEKIGDMINPEITIMEGVQRRLNMGLSESEADHRSFKAILNEMKETPINGDDLNSSLVKNSQMIFASKGRTGFETKTGFTVVGSTIKDVLTNSGREIFKEGNKIHVRINLQDDSKTALIILHNGNSIPVAILKDYIGTLIFKKNQLLTINYTPSLYSDKYYLYDKYKNRIDFVRSFVASAANEGFDYLQAFRDEFTKEGYLNYQSAGGYLRQEKSIDPSLGLYAVYAYRQEGKFREIKSVYDFIVQEQDSNMIFDVAMLANKLPIELKRIAPFCPMIAVGWAYRHHFDKFLDKKVKEASEYLVPSLWTTFNKQGTELIRTIF